MSRTKRFYNYPNKILSEFVIGAIGKIPYWHPYKRIWSNKCGSDDEYLMSKRRRAYHKIEVKRELINLCPYNSLVGKDMCFNCLIRWYGDDCEYMNEKKLHSFKEQYDGAWL